MAAEANDWTVDFAQIGRRVRRRWRVVLAAMLILTAVAGIAGLLLPRSYSATSSVSVSPIRLSTSYSNQDVNISTERAVISTREVASIAAQRLGGGISPETLMNASSVAAPSGSDVLQVTVSGSSPKEAASRANALANAYLQFRAQGALEAARPSIDALQQRIDAASSKKSASVVDLRAQLTALQQIGDATARVIGRADAASAVSSSFGLPVYLVGGLIGGLLVGVVLALLRDAGDRRLRLAARYAELAGHEAVTVRGGEDLEGARWVARTVRKGIPNDRPAVVAVVTATGASSTSFLDSMQALAKSGGYSTDVVQADLVPLDALDRGWQFDSASDHRADLVLIDAQQVTSGAQRAVLGDAVDATVIVAGRSTRVKDVRTALDAVRRSDARIVPVFLDERGSSRDGQPVVSADRNVPVNDRGVLREDLIKTDA